MWMKRWSNSTRAGHAAIPDSRRPDIRIGRGRRDAAVIAALTDVVARYPRWGFWKCYDRLRLEGSAWNHKRVHRVYCAWTTAPN